MSGFFNKVKNIGLNWLGLSKQNNQNIGLVNKAKDWISGGLSFLNSKPVKEGINFVSQYLPQAKNLVSDVKKYGHMANNLIGDFSSSRPSALSKKFDRFQKNLEERRKPSIELPMKQRDYIGDVSSLF